MNERDDLLQEIIDLLDLLNEEELIALDDFVSKMITDDLDQ